MINKKAIMVVSMLLILSISACNGNIQVDLPTPTTQPEEEAASTEISKPTEPAATNAGEIFFGSLATLQTAYEQLYEKVLPSVVSIYASRTVSRPQFSLPEFGMPDIPFDEDELAPDLQERAAGSGFVWDTEGHIVTNNHVVEGATTIRVTFSDGTSVLAELVGADSASDLAVLKVNVPTSQLKPIEVTDSTKVKVGQIAIAIGNPFQLSGSMTTGIISGTGRSLTLDQSGASGLYYSIPDIIQTDAAINPGNSGGPLVDIEGQLLGVTTAIESPVRANSGIGYVVPSIIVSKVVPILISEGEYQQPWIGISGRDLIPELAELMDLEPEQQGALVIEITAGSPADEAGLIGSSIEGKVDGTKVLVGGDVITGVDGQPINDFEDLVAYLARYALVGQTINLEVLRNGETLEIPLTLAARPASEGQLVEEMPEETTGGGAWLGILAVNVTPEIASAMALESGTRGALVQQVSEGSPADEAGIRGSYKPLETSSGQILTGGDIITAIDGEVVDGNQSLTRVLAQYDPGDEVELTIMRDGKTNEIRVTLGERPAN